MLRLIFDPIRTSLLLISLLGCAGIFAQTANIDKGCVPLSVNFTAPAGAATWFWDFKDGVTSTLQNPSNLFTTPGTKVVEFRNSQNGPVVGTVTITVWPKPDVMLLATPSSGCTPLNVQFEDKSVVSTGIQITDYVWVFGDGGSAVGSPNPSHTYTTAGSFGVSLELQTNFPSCNITKVFPNSVKTSEAPIVAFTTTPSPAQACNPPLSVSVTDNTTGGLAPLTYAWDFGNGNTSGVINPPAQNYTQTGLFTIKLTVTDALGCSASTTRSVNIGSPIVDFVFPDTVCRGQDVTFQNLSPLGLSTWNFGPNASPVSSTLTSPSVEFYSFGPQNVTLTLVAPGGCQGTKTKTIFVEKPDASFTVSPTYSCTEPVTFSLNATANNTTDWIWTFPTGTSPGSIKNPNYTYVNADVTGYTLLGEFKDSIELVVVTPAGCRDTVRQEVVVWQPNARFVPDLVQGCAPLSVIFSDSSFSNENIVQWSWFFDDGSPLMVQGNGNPVSHTFTQAGEYDVQLIIRNSAGCIDTSYQIRIEVGVPLTGDFTVDKTEICPGDSVTFTSLSTDPRIDGLHFYADGNRVWHCFQEKSVTWTHNTAADLFDASLMIEYNGCFNEIVKNDLVRVKGPIAKLHYKTTCENTLSFEFTDESSEATSLTWSLGDGDSSFVQSFTHLYDSAGTYTVILTAENASSGCPISRDTATVYPTQLQAKFDLPLYICAGQPYDLDGAESSSVNATCYKGYTWYFDFQRPIRTDDPLTPFAFSDNGPHQLWLEVEDINGCRDTIVDSVRVYAQYPRFELSDSLICLPGMVNFFDQSTADTTIVSWQWDFGDGSPTSSAVNPSHTFSNPPVGGATFYTVTLTITDILGCPVSYRRNVFIYKPISSIIMSPPPALCEDEIIQFNGTDFTAGGSNLSFAWNFGDGGTGAGQTLTHAYALHGTYTVTLTFTENATGCTGTKTAVVQVQSFPDAAFTSNVDSLTILCYPQNIQLLNTSTSIYPVTITWLLGNGQTSVGNTAATVFPKGTYSIGMAASTSFGCADTTYQSFTVVGPEGNFDMDKTEICLGDSVFLSIRDTVDISSFSWSFGDGTMADNVGEVAHQYNSFPPSGQTVVKLLLKGEDDACAFTVEKPLKFSQIAAAFNAIQDTVCLGVSHQFVNGSISDDEWAWDFGDGTSAITENATHEYTQEGNYDVTLIVRDLPLGCADTLKKTVKVSGLPNFEAIGDVVCPGDTGVVSLLAPVPGATYTWTPSNTVLPPQNASSVRVLPTESTIYTVDVTVASTGCMDTDTAFVLVPSIYDGASDLDTLVEQGSTVNLPVTEDPNFIFMWMPTTLNSPYAVRPDNASIFDTLVVKDQYGCEQPTYFFAVRVFPQKLQAPNAFTPGDEAPNNAFLFYAEGERGLIQVNYLRIYNRWGQQVFEGSGTDQTPFWDGTVDGKPAPVDLYVWIAEVTYLTGRREMLKGELSLIR